MSPLHDFHCDSCDNEFEELHGKDEEVFCPSCNSKARIIMSKLADYTGQASMTVQYTTRNSPIRDSHIQKPNMKDPTFLRNKIPTRRI